MGFDIDWERRGECEPLPEKFTYRYKDCRLFMHVLLDCDTEYVNPDCCGGNGNHVYMCSSTGWNRPKDFAEFREKLKEAGIYKDVFIEMVDYLERNPNMYLGQ